MQRFCFKKGIIFVEFNNRWQLSRRLVTNKLQFENEQGEILTLLDHEVFDRWMSGKWTIDEASLSKLEDVIFLAAPRDLATYPEKWQKIAMRRKQYLDAINPKVNTYHPARWQAIIQATAIEIGDAKPPSAISVQTWWRGYRHTESILQLLPKTARGGVRPRKTDERYLVFEEALEAVYLTIQKMPKIAAVNFIQQRITELNLSRSAQSKVKPLARSTVYRWLAELRQELVDQSRLGANLARVKYRVAMGGLKVNQVLERLEIDHTPLDLIVLDKLTQLPLGRPWLSLAIDKHSRMVMGFYICFNAPSSHSVLQCLKQAILPKTQILERFPDIQGQWPAHGIPDLIAVDNGMDLHSKALEKSCLEIGTQILFCPAANPEAKGSVERFFRTLNHGLIHTLPGTVFSGVCARGDYPAEELATIDMEVLVHLVVKWIADVYNMTPHRGIGTTPLLKWNESAQHRIIDLPIYPKQIEVIAGIPAMRTVFHYGIELEGLHYNSQALQEIRKISGENLQVQLKFYEDTVAHIHVFNPYSKEYIQVASVHEDYTHRLHRETHRLAREHARKQLGDKYSMPQLAESLKAIQTIIKEAIQAKKMGQRKLSANLLMHDSQAVFEARAPMAEALKPAKFKKIAPPDQLPSGLLDDLPDLMQKIADEMDFGKHEESINEPIRNN